MAVFVTGTCLPNRPIIVTVTGTGGSATGKGRCLAVINGMTYTYEASGIEVFPSDIITFSVYGGSGEQNAGTVTINGTKVFSVIGAKTGDYEWTVPDNITAITINLSVVATAGTCGRITVTTS